MTFKFIPNTNTALTAADATTTDLIDLGSAFKGQTKKSSFQIGNTGISGANFTCVVSGVESDIRDNVSYSLNGIDWSGSVAVSGIAANGVSDLIHVKFTPDANDFTASGSFLINVVEG